MDGGSIGRVYIGFTNDPSRRVIQHNKGSDFGGAKKTNNKGPWEMVLVIFGFPNKISALKFEWAWQNPIESRATKYLALVKAKREKHFDYSIRILGHLINLPPWKRLPLNICWLNGNYKINFDSDVLPPSHMPIMEENIFAQKIKCPELSLSESTHLICYLCKNNIEDKDKIMCFIPNCYETFHTICLAKHFLKDCEELIPIEGSCPKCSHHLLWGNLVRYKAGFLRKEIELETIV